MRVLIATAGRRGDVAPFTGLAAGIRAAGHDVTISSNDEYEGLVAACGLDFRPLPGTHGMFLEDERWIRELGGPRSAPKLIRLLAEHVRTLHKAILTVARQDAPDVLALSGVATVAGYHIADGLGLPAMDLLLQPGHATADFAPAFVTGRSFGRLRRRNPRSPAPCSPIMSPGSAAEPGTRARVDIHLARRPARGSHRHRQQGERRD